MSVGLDQDGANLLIDVAKKALELGFDKLKSVADFDKMVRDYLQNKDNAPKAGIRPLAEVMGTNTNRHEETATIDISAEKDALKDFGAIAKKYGIICHIIKDDPVHSDKGIVVFRAKDADLMTKAFQEYTDVRTKAKEKEKAKAPTWKDKLKEAMDKAKSNREKQKEKHKETEAR